MKAKIDSKGHLYLERKGPKIRMLKPDGEEEKEGIFWKLQYCPFTGNGRNRDIYRECGDHCPFLHIGKCRDHGGDRVYCTLAPAMEKHQLISYGEK